MGNNHVDWLIKIKDEILKQNEETKNVLVITLGWEKGANFIPFPWNYRQAVANTQVHTF